MTLFLFHFLCIIQTALCTSCRDKGYYIEFLRFPQSLKEKGSFLRYKKFLLIGRCGNSSLGMHPRRILSAPPPVQIFSLSLQKTY